MFLLNKKLKIKLIVSNVTFLFVFFFTEESTVQNINKFNVYENF